MDKLDKKIPELIKETMEAFSGVTLENGVSWREANVLDAYGTMEERKVARDKDEKNDWTRIPVALIGDLKYQSVMPFLDPVGLKFYLPACMIYTLKNYKESQSLIIHSIIYTLTSKTTAYELQEILDQRQRSCIVKFLHLCLEIGEKYFDLHKAEIRIQKYWSENAPNDEAGIKSANR